MRRFLTRTNNCQCWSGAKHNDWQTVVGITLNYQKWSVPKILYLYWDLATTAIFLFHLDRVKRIWYLSPMRAAKVQASLRIRAVSPEPSLLAHTSSESRGTFRQKARSLAPLNGWACAVKICQDGMLEDTNSLDGAHLMTCKSKSQVIDERMKRTLFDFCSGDGAIFIRFTYPSRKFSEGLSGREACWICNEQPPRTNCVYCFLTLQALCMSNGSPLHLM